MSILNKNLLVAWHFISIFSTPFFIL